MSVPYAARLVTTLGDIARTGRSGLLLLDAGAGVRGGALTFHAGVLGSFQPPPGAGKFMEAGNSNASELRKSIGAAVESIGASGGSTLKPTFRQDDALTKGVATPPPGGLNAADLAIDLARHIADTHWLAERMTAIAGARVSMASTPPSLQPNLVLGPGEGYLLSRADGTLTLREILDSAPLGEIETQRAIFSLIAAGMLAPPSVVTGTPRLSDLDTFLKKTDATGGKYSADEQKERDELLARCKSTEGQDYYGVLGVEDKADDSTIRHTYYKLARAYHPDRLLKPHLEDMHRELEGMFAVFTDAYNTLSDSTLRSEYDRERATRGAGPRKPGTQDKHAAARDSYLRGRKEEDAGHLFEAIRLFETAIQNDPARAEYFHHLGVCQGQNPRWRKKAEENLLQAIKINPSAVRSYLELARVYHKGGLARRASEMYQQVLTWEPGNQEALAALGPEKEAAGPGLLGGLFKKE